MMSVTGSAQPDIGGITTNREEEIRIFFAEQTRMYVEREVEGDPLIALRRSTFDMLPGLPHRQDHAELLQHVQIAVKALRP